MTATTITAVGSTPDRSGHRWARAFAFWLASYRRVWRGSVFESFVSPLFFLAAMGFGLGLLVDAGPDGGMGGVSYVQFIAPGILAAQAMNTAVGESTYPVLGGVKWFRQYHAMLATPLRIPDVVLGHLAFWDQRTLILIDRWEKEGLREVPRSLDDRDVDWINDSAKALCLALPPRAAARLAVAVADEVDRRVETMSDELVAANAAGGRPINLLRAEHRREHLDEIERAFGQSPAP